MKVPKNCHNLGIGCLASQCSTYMSQSCHKIQTVIYLIQHPFEANCSRALVLGSTGKPVQIVDPIQSGQDRRNIVSPLFGREYLPIGAHICMAVQKSLKPSAARSLHRQDGEKPHRITSTFSPTQNKKVALLTKS